jgi:hypothetical protein
LEVKVNGRRALRLEPSTASPNLIGGYSANTVDAGVSGATIGGGGQSWAPNQVAADYGTISGGSANAISDYALYGTIAGGQDNSIKPYSTNATISGGAGNVIWAQAEYATIPGGTGAKANSFGQMAYASGNFSATGDAQSSLFVLRGKTLANAGGTAEAELFLDGISERMTVPLATTWAFDALIVGRAADGDSFAMQVKGLIQNEGGILAIKGSPVVEKIAGSGNPIYYTTTAEADSINDALVIKVSRMFADTGTRWVATVRTSEVAFPFN